MAASANYFPGEGCTLKWPIRMAPPEKGYLFKLQVYERVVISQVEVYKRVGKSVMHLGI